MIPHVEDLADWFAAERGAGLRRSLAVGRWLRHAFVMGRVHGSKLVDIAVGYEVAPGAQDALDNDVGWLVSEGILRVETPAAASPTPSQRAFLGLAGIRKHPGFVPGCRLHFWFAWGVSLQSSSE